MTHPSRRPRGGRTRRHVILILALVLASAALGAWAPGVWAAGPGSDGRATASTVRLRIMEFNIEYGGDLVSFGRVADAILASGADVVGIEEAWGHIPRLARKLGWDFYDVRTQIVSRYPLIDPPGAKGRYTFVQVRPGRVVAIGNVHLPSWPYGPNLVRAGRSRSDVLEVERRVRLPEVRPALRALSALVGRGIPSFLVGDFNSPSFRDWTAETVGRSCVRYPVRWPVSAAVEKAGFVDSYREAHPSAVARPGFTWPAGRPEVDGWNPGPHACDDRIDLVYASGAETLASTIVGEAGAPDVSVSVSPWPSDHRAVLSTFRVEPAPPPTLVAVDRRLATAGDDLAVTFHGPGGPGESVAIVAAGGDPSAAIARQPTGDGAPTDGTLIFGTDGWVSGGYEAVLVDPAGAALARIPFWVRQPGEGPVVETSKQTYAVGEPIDVAWHNGPGNRWDWIGVYKRGADPNVAWYILWRYSDASVVGSLVFDETAYGPWPLKAGRYSVYLLEDDGYRVLARADFTIAG